VIAAVLALPFDHIDFGLAALFGAFALLITLGICGAFDR
jgi:hypothetical protein